MTVGVARSARFDGFLAVLVLTSSLAWAQGKEPAGPTREEASGAAATDKKTFEDDPYDPRKESAPSGAAQPAKTSGEISVLPFFFWTGVIVLAIGGAAALVRRIFPGAKSLFPSTAIQVIGRRAISSTAAVVLVEVGNRILRLGVSKDGLLYMGEISDPVEIALVKGKVAEGKADSATRTFQEELVAGVKEAEKAPKPPPPSPEEKEDDIRAELNQIRRTLDGWKA